MATYIGSPFRTREGAEKRARFENAHQTHLVRRYRHTVVQTEKGLYRVQRELVKESKK